MRAKLETRGHKILQVAKLSHKGVVRIVYLSQKNDVYDDGEVERWHIHTNCGHVRHGCYRSQVERWFHEYIRQYVARGIVNLT